MIIRKWTAAMMLAAVLATAGTAVAAPTVPGAVYSDQQAAGTNKPVAQIQQELQAAGIRDVQPSDWYAGPITVIVQAGLLPPMADGQFHPEQQLNAGDGIAVFAKVLGIASKTDTPEQALAKAQEAGLVQPGVTVDRDLSRIEVARLLGRALGVEPRVALSPAGYPFADFELMDPVDAGLMKALYDLGIFRGYEDHTFRPNNILTRAEIALLVDRILGAH